MGNPIHKGKCIVCKRDVYTYDEDDMLNSASYLVIHCGYGSCHDLSEFQGFVCDRCLDDLIDDSILAGTREYQPINAIDGTENKNPWQTIDEHKKELLDLYTRREMTREGQKINRSIDEDRRKRHE